MKLILPAINVTLILSLFCFSGCTSERASKTALDSLEQEALQKEHERWVAQREAIDLLVRGQMKEGDVNSSKQEFAAKNWKTLFDFFIGEELAGYPQLAEIGDKLDQNFTAHHMLQKENARQWMAEQKNETMFLAFATDVWDFRQEGGMEFFDTLIIAVHEGRILGYQRFAECPY